MESTTKLDRMFDAIESVDKEKLVSVVTGLSSVEIEEMAKIIAGFRSANESARISLPSKKVKVEIIRPLQEEINDEQEEISDEEHKEIEEAYGKRAKSPQSDFIKYENHEQFYDLIMKHKKEQGWKFKDEK